MPVWTRAEQAVAALLEDVGRPKAEVSVVLTGDEQIRDLNRNWRGKDRATDVLSWPQGDDETDEADAPDALGDVVISFPTAQRQAQARGWGLNDEIALLLVHGVLHLLGHEDDTESGSAEMRKIEARLLGKPLDPLPPSAQTENVG